MFKDIIKDTIIQEEITLDSFLLAVDEYLTFDDALVDLDESYFQFYIDNEDILNKSLKLSEADLTIGMSPTEEVRYKTVKYKGNFITLVYDPDLHSWFPTIRFRSIIPALKYGKSLADSIL